MRRGSLDQWASSGADLGRISDKRDTGWRTKLTVVLLTHNSAPRLEQTLDHLSCLGVEVVAVDNASTDGTVEMLRNATFVQVIALRRDLGAAARNRGASRARTPYIAFCDDDGWYELSGLATAVTLLDAHPCLALLNGRVFVGSADSLDPTSAELAQGSIAGGDGLPGTGILRFMAGAVVMRRAAFQDVGGYDKRFFTGAEEETLAVPLARRGWQMRFVPDVVIHRAASQQRRRTTHFEVRNTLINAWLHRPLRSALLWTWFVVSTTSPPWQLLWGLGGVLLRVPWIVRERDVMPPELDRMFCGLDARRRSAMRQRRRSDHPS